MHDFDVVVAGGGNAGLCAAMAAAENGAHVLLIERGSEKFRGGNSAYTRDIRCGSKGEDGGGQYSEDEFLEDLLRVTKRETNLELAKLAIRESFNMPSWMSQHGVIWQKALKGTLHLSRTNKFFIGGGKAMINSYYQHALKDGIRIRYDSTVKEISIRNDSFEELVVEQGGERSTVTAKSLIVCSGGFESNLTWLKQYWGDATNNFIIRGTRNNDGLLLRRLLDDGVMPTGDPKEFHAIAVDARSPNYDGGITTRVDSVPFSVMLDREGRRFYDEGEDLWPKRYAIWGKLIAEQPDQVAYSIFDSRVEGKFLPTLFAPYKADTISQLSEMLGLNPQAVIDTITQYNDHVRSGNYDTSVLDECGTDGLDPPKSHWALRIDKPPFYAYPLRPGITFTYFGVKVDKDARVVASGGKPIANIFAAGEIMSGNILTRGYLAGFGLTIGTTFGRIAGWKAAEVG